MDNFIIIKEIENCTDISKDYLNGITNFADIDIEDMIKNIIKHFI